MELASTRYNNVLSQIKQEKTKRRRELLEALRKNKWALASLYIIIALCAMSLVSFIYTPYNPFQFNLAIARQPPSLSHPLGTDELGRDILSRIMYGGRYTLGISFISVTLGALIGVALGILAGYYGGKVDTVIMRIVDIMLAFPTILLAIALVAAVGQGVKSLILAISITTFPVYARLVRGTVLQIVNEDYITAAKLIGLSSYKIMVKHVLPNTMSVIIVQMSYYMGLSILLASALGFLGLGVPPPKPEWGTMIGGGRTYFFSTPHIVVIPGIFIFITSLAFNLLGDGLREALDPKLRGLLRRG
jgi:peptide/nickel transport system permease protein/oligopeptide transport system permease protein